MKNLLLILELARILAGETPTCPIEAKISAAYVWEVNKVWYANKEPTALDYYVAFNYTKYPNPTPGAKFFVNKTDVKNMPFLGDMLQEWICTGTTVRAYN